MISMTGFGRAQGRGPAGLISVEIRSVNHRYLEVSGRLPEGCAALDDAVRAIVQERLARGKVTVTVALQGRPSVTATVNAPVARQYLTALRRLQRELRIGGEVTIEHLAGLPGVVTSAATESATAWKPLVLRVVRAALRQLVATRQREGRALTRALQQLTRHLTQATETLTGRAPQVVAEYRTRLEARIRTLTTQPLDPGRLEQEVAFFAKECDIAEELTRIRAHVAHLTSLVASRTPVGRTVDFVAQELQREVNTIGSKANDVEIARLAIQMKGWVEQLREQAQNIE